MNRKMILGLVVVAVAAAIEDLFIFHNAKYRPGPVAPPPHAIPNLIFFMCLIFLGGYLMYQGKKQQKEERDNNN